MLPVDPADLYTVESLAEKTRLPVDTIYDLVADTSTLGRRLGFKLGRRWFVHPADWDEFVAARRGVAAGDLPNASPATSSRRAS